MLLARRCTCGHLSLPPQPYGCERCGRTKGESVEVPARGVVTAIATVHVHPKLETPFVLGRITLDAGPSVEVQFDAAPDAIPIGTRVVGVDSGTGICRFVAEGAR